jgi:hypothetical protein
MRRDEAERLMAHYADATGKSPAEVLRELMGERFEAEAEQRVRERLEAEEADLDEDGPEADEESWSEAVEAETAEDFELELWWTRPRPPASET